jgi:UDP-glucose 4-epimerase
MSILSTNAAGDIESHNCLELLMAGHHVVALDNFSNTKLQSLNRAEWIRKFSVII